MKNLIRKVEPLIVALVFIGIVVIGFNYSFGYTEAKEQNNAQACGISGIILRADNSVVIDGWKDYSASRIANPSNPVIEFKHAPSAVHLGRNLSDGTLICLESALGSSCKTIEEYRKGK